jgi:hypothetical protein
MRYLKQTIDLKLEISANYDVILRGYVDADWAGNADDRKSTSGYLFFLGRNLISWSSKKQNCVALSSTKAEYISAALAGQEIVWLRQLLEDMHELYTQSTTIYEDNQGCIKLANNEKTSSRTKHIDVRYHYLRDLVENNIIAFEYCETMEMVADAMTKPLARLKLEEHRNAMGLICT